MFIVPQILLTWKEARLWLTDRLCDVSLTALVRALDTCVSRSFLYVSQIANHVLDWLCSLRDLIVARTASIHDFLHKSSTRDDSTEASNM